MAILAESPARRNGKTRWIDPEPRGIADWTLCVCMIVLAGECEVAGGRIGSKRLSIWACLSGIHWMSNTPRALVFALLFVAVVAVIIRKRK